MKRLKPIIYISMILFFSIFLTSCNQTKLSDNNSSNIVKTEKANFRNICWGMSQKEVKNIETAEFSEEDKDIIVYSENVADLKAYLVYVFEADKLYMGFYNFQNSHTSGNLYIEDYSTIKEKVTSIYGKPTSDRIETLNDLWKKPADSLMMGSSIYTTTWVLDDTIILLTMNGDNYVLTTSLAYRDSKYKSPVNISGL